VRAENTGIVEKNVEPVEDAESLLHRSTALRRLAHIGANEDSGATVVHDFFDNCLAALFVAAGDRNFGALLCEQNRRGFADAGCAAGDHSDFIF
jgi:hypothetical protein